MMESTAAYGQCVDDWVAGPDSAYRAFARALVAAAPLPVDGLSIVDIGAGAGAVSRALMDEGASVTATDASGEMLQAARLAVPGLATVSADAADLPFGDSSFDAATSGFCLNHLAEPHCLLAEAARVTRAGGFILASTFSRGDEHSAKQAVERVAREWGWRRPKWYERQSAWAQLTDTEDGLIHEAHKAGLERTCVHRATVDTGLITAESLVASRLGLAQFAAFLKTLGREERMEMTNAAEAVVGGSPRPLVREILILSARVSA
jgi:SAM-dependent methyltransferase